MLDLFRTLRGVVKDIESSEALREAIAFACWRRIAGEGLAEHAVPLKLDGEVLSIAVSNVMWQRQLKELAGQMVFKLNAAIGEPAVSFIEFKIDEEAVLSSRLRSSASDEDLLREAEKEMSPQLVQAAEAIEDDALKGQFLLAAGKCLARRKRFESRR